MPQAQKSSSPKQNQNLLAGLIYILDILSIVGIVVSLIFLFAYKKNNFVRFHAAQSLITFGILFIITTLLSLNPGPGILDSLRVLVGLVELVVWVLLMVQAFRGIRYKLPYIGNLAELLLKKIG